MTQGLLDLIISRLERARLDPEVETLILAACEGEAELAAYLNDPNALPQPERSEVTQAAVPGVFLEKLSVEGFRGIGREAALEIPEGPWSYTDHGAQRVGEIQLLRGPRDSPDRGK